MFSEVHIFIDQSKSKAKKWREENDKELADCDLVILIITPAALQSQEIEREIQIANEGKKLILPCKMNATNCDWTKLKWDLGSYDGIEFENDEDLRTSLFSEVEKIKEEFPNKLQVSSNSSSNIISVELDNQSYADGDKIIISGKVEELLSMPISLSILSPNDQLVNLNQIVVNPDKTYAATITAGGSLMQNEGNYTVKVLYGYPSRTAKTTFNFKGSARITRSKITEDTIVIEGTNSEIKYIIQRGKIISAVKDLGISSLILGIESIKNGEIILAIPRDVLDAQINNVDDDFFVLIDAAEIDFDEIKTDYFRTLTIPFPSNSKEIEIIGISQSSEPPRLLFKKQFTSDSNLKSLKQFHTISLTTSFDKTVYPLKSKLYIRVNCPDIIFGKTIDLVITDSKNKVIRSKQIDPITHPDSELKQAGIYQESFQMNETDMNIGEVYTVHASHGDAWAEDTCVVDRRTPVIQTDNSVYLLGSDMILSVIDPDADKDSQKPEFVGDSSESLLTISSSIGSIDGYKLRETGDSTGIFQGTIGLVGVLDNGTIIPYVHGNKEISKTQGVGIDDGFLQVKPNDEIKISYKNKSNIITLIAFLSFAVVIVLDQKVYSWTDKVRITIVAPCFSKDPINIEKIGNNTESSLTIKTRRGKIENYELIETGPNTGIFTGEVLLSGFQYDKLDPYIINNFGKSSGKGPDDGIISCDSDDEISIEFTTKNETVVGLALIRWNVGNIKWMKPKYTIFDSAIISVIDPDMNPNLMDIFKIRVWSDSDSIGTEVVVVETSPESGIFVANILFSTKTEDGISLKVSPGDSVIAEYLDFTLPEPYQKGDSLKITASANIVSNQ